MSAQLARGCQSHRRSIISVEGALDADVQQRVDEIAAQLAAGQEQVTRDINKLQEVEQDILDKISAPPPRPVAAPVRKSVPLPPLPPTPPEGQPAL